MEHLQPRDLAAIGACLLIYLAGGYAWHYRRPIVAFAAAVFHYFFQPAPPPVEVRRAPEPNAPVRPPVRHQEADEPRSPGSFVRSEPEEEAGALLLNAEEIAAVARMIAHNRSAERPTQTSTIEAGFGIRGRGDSPRYRRAKAIYDALFNAEPAVKYPTLEAQRARHAAARAALEDIA